MCDQVFRDLMPVVCAPVAVVAAAGEAGPHGAQRRTEESRWLL